MRILKKNNKTINTIFSLIVAFSMVMTPFSMVNTAQAQANSECTINGVEVGAGDTIVWNASLAGSGDTVTYSWIGTDGLSGSSDTVTKTYLTAGPKSATVTVTATGSSASTDCTLFDYEVIDNPDPNTPPEITLNQPELNPMEITVGDTFTDPGATATDAEDNDEDLVIVVTGSVDENTVETYTLTYTVTDSGGLSDSVDRTINVVPAEDPNTPPVITLNGDNPINIVEGETFTDPGATATDAEDNDEDLVIVVTGTVDSNTVGTYTLTYTVTDSGGLSDSVTRTVNVTEDTTAICSVPVTTTQDNQTITWTTTPDIDASQNPTYSWSGDDGLSGNGTTTTHTYATAGTYTGQVIVTADNSPACNISTTINEPDNPPTITLIGDNPLEIIIGDTFTDPRATADDPEDGDITEDIIVSGSVDENTIGTYVLVYSVTDSDGNTVSVNRDVVVKAADSCLLPVITSDLSVNGKINETFSYTITADNADNTEKYSIDETALPAGLSFGTTTDSAYISGIPTETGTFTIDITVGNDCGDDSVTETLTITIGSGGGGGGNPTPTGSVVICKVVVGPNDSYATTTDGIPESQFRITFGKATTTVRDATVIEEINWNSQNLSFNGKVFGGEYNDATCKSYTGLDIDHYYYSEEEILTTDGLWTTVGYNDQYTISADNIGDFFEYFPSELPGEQTTGVVLNSDGHIILTEDRPNRVLVVRNDYIDSIGQCDVPVITSVKDIEYTKGQDFEYTFTVDSDSDTEIDVDNTTLPPGFSFSTSTGNAIITGNSESAGGIYDVSVTLENDCGTATDTITITVPTGGGGGGGGSTPPTTGGGGGGVVFQQTLNITNENIEQVTSGSVFVNWDTSIAATSRVVWGTESVSNPDEDLENYGYSNTTGTITELTRDHKMGVVFEPGVTYYFRPVSTYGNLSDIGIELSITPQSLPGQCVYLNDYLRIDFDNDPTEVLKLQAYLNSFEGEDLELDGVFDIETENAVNRYQEKYFGSILNPWGHEAPTGYVYILTQKHINETYCNRAFPLTELEEVEIEQFRQLLETLEDAGVPDAGVVSPDDIPNVDTPDVNDGTIGLDDLLDGVGGGDLDIDNNDGDIIVIGGDDDNTDNTAAQNLASVLFAFPDSVSDWFECLGWLLLILLIVYLLGTVLVNAINGDEDENVRESRMMKIAVYVIGLVYALIPVLLFDINCVVLPILVIIAILVIGFIYLIFKNRKEKRV